MLGETWGDILGATGGGGAEKAARQGLIMTVLRGDLPSRFETTSLTPTDVILDAPILA